MVAKCKCGVNWSISIKAKIPKDGYKCPICRTKEMEKSKKRQGRVPKVLLNNKKKFDF